MAGVLNSITYSHLLGSETETISFFDPQVTVTYKKMIEACFTIQILQISCEIRIK